MTTYASEKAAQVAVDGIVHFNRYGVTNAWLKLEVRDMTSHEEPRVVMYRPILGQEVTEADDGSEAVRCIDENGAEFLLVLPHPDFRLVAPALIEGWSPQGA